MDSQPTMRSAASSAVLGLLLAFVGGAYANGDSSAQSPPATARRQQPGAGCIVLLKLDPVVAYTGDIPGLAASHVQNSSKVNMHSPTVRAYAQFLDSQSTMAAARAGVTDRIQYLYKYTLAAFSTGVLSDKEIQALQQDSVILEVRRQRLNSIKTYSTPRFSGPVGNSSSHASSGGAPNISGLNAAGAHGAPATGEGVVIGVIDTGIWPEAESFSDQVQPPLAQVTSDSLAARCKQAVDYPQTFCNNKVVGCSWFNKGWGGDLETKKLFPEAHISCRDENGHGTHVAGIAAGNSGVPYMFGSISGMAPRARIAVYKAFWGKDAANTDADTLAAVEQAVADQVDILNYSAGPSFAAQTFRDPVSLAFMGAARAGIFVTLSAGNEGNRTSTVTSVDPWATVVAASTHDREIMGSLRLGQGVKFEGMGFAVASVTVGPAELVLAEEAAVAGVNRTEARLCYQGSLDPALVQGRIVVCDCGVTGRTAKSAEVQTAGGVAMVLLNSEPDADYIIMDAHTVPTLYLKFAARADIRRHTIAGNAGAASLSFKAVLSRSAVRVADFSSRGPALAGNGVLLKPDITAPGVDIYAATSPALAPHQQYAYMSGTSMATPHIAGLAALLHQKHPSWSPMVIKSALMTTAYQQTRSGKQWAPIASPLAMGAGHVDPTHMFNPGLVFNSDYTNWQRFLCGAERQTTDRLCAVCQEDPESCDPKNFNTPSITLPRVLVSHTTVVYRAVTNVLHVVATFRHNASLDVTTSRYLQVKVVPESFTLAPGETQMLEIQVQVLPDAPHNKYLSGGVSWSSSAGTVTRIPLAVSPVAMAAPAAVSVSSKALTSGSATSMYNITTAYTEAISAQPHGVVPGVVRRGTLQTEYGTFGILIPQGIALARFQLLQSDYSTNTDLDMEVSLDNQIVSTSWTSGTSNETLDLYNPVPGLYEFGMHLHSFAVPSSPIGFKLHTFLVPKVDMHGSSSLKVAKKRLVGGLEVVELSVDDFNLQPAGRHLGLVQYSRGDDVLSSTVVDVV